jgi:manganese/iron transport system permease protein
VFTSLLAPFHYDYMVTALWTSALIGGVCGLLSGFVTLKGWSLMGDALSHAVVPGVAIAYLLGLPFAVGAFTSGLLAAGAMAFVKMKTPVREDAVIGIVFTAFFALGLLLISLFPSRVDLKGIIFGNILGIATGDVVQVVIVSAVCLLVLALKWRDLASASGPSTSRCCSCFPPPPSPRSKPSGPCSSSPCSSPRARPPICSPIASASCCESVPRSVR